MKKSAIVPFLIFPFLVSCATSELIVESQPDGADVIAKFRDSSVKKIGITPLRVNETQVGNNSDAYEIIVSKEKFQRESVIVSPSKFPREVKINLKLDSAIENIATLSPKDFNDAVRMTAQAQSSIKAKDYDQAERTLSSALIRFQSIPTFYTLLGNTYYLKKDLDKALVQYKKARELDPQSSENDVMIKKIETLRGGSQGSF